MALERCIGSVGTVVSAAAVTRPTPGLANLESRGPRSGRQRVSSEICGLRSLDTEGERMLGDWCAILRALRGVTPRAMFDVHDGAGRPWTWHTT